MKLLLYCPVAHSERFFFKMLLRYNERELVASQQVLEELFNEEERIAIYRAHYELEKAKAEARENGMHQLRVLVGATRKVGCLISCIQTCNIRLVNC